MGSRCVFHSELPHPRDESNVVPRAASPLCFGEGWGRGSSAQSQTPPLPALGVSGVGRGRSPGDGGEDEGHVVLPRLAVTRPTELRALESWLSKTKADVNTKPRSSRD